MALTFQKNRWLRKNIYWRDGTQEETPPAQSRPVSGIERAGGVLYHPMLCSVSTMIFTVIFAAGMPAVLSEEIPTLWAINNLSGAGMISRVLYVVFAIAAMLSSSVAFIFTVCNRFEPVIERFWTKSTGFSRKLVIAMVFILVCTFGSSFGLLNIIKYGYVEAGHFGDIMATACKVRGIAGVVIEGSCRDAQNIVALGLPVFVRGLNPSGTVKESLAKLNVPVRCGGVEVRPGDIVLGDCDGVIVVPRSDEDAVFEKVLNKFDKEQHIVEALLAGKTTLEVYGFDKLIERKLGEE